MTILIPRSEAPPPHTHTQVFKKKSNRSAAYSCFPSRDNRSRSKSKVCFHAKSNALLSTGRVRGFLRVTAVTTAVLESIPRPPESRAAANVDRNSWYVVVGFEPETFPSVVRSTGSTAKSHMLVVSIFLLVE